MMNDIFKNITDIKNYMGIMLRGIKDSKLREEILHFNTEDCLHIQPRSCGHENRGKTIFLIDCISPDYGFFAVHRATLLALLFAERCGMTPVVRYGEKYLYADRQYSSLRGKDPFEYYFKQPCGISIQSALKSAAVVSCLPVHIYMTELFLNGNYGVYDASEQFYAAAALMQSKYIGLNNRTRSFFNKSIGETLPPGRILGVHVRGSDFKRRYNIHPVRVTPEEYIAEIEKMISDGGWDGIFLATDDTEAVELFTNRFGSRVSYYHDVTRTRGQQSVAFSHSARKYHHFRLGLEVLRDVYTLASCSGLVAGVSQISICARVLRQSFGKEYEYLKILDRGVHHNGNNFVKRGK